MTGNLSTSAVGTSAASEPKDTTTMGGASVLPTDRPLTAGDVKLLSKLMDTLKPFAEVAEKLKHCHVVEICEPTPDNPSRNIIPMPREWFERAGDDLEAIVIQLHSGGVLSEGQASKMTGLDRIEVRKLSDAYRLSRPATSAASEVEDFAGKLTAIRDKFLMPTPDKDHTDYAVITRCIAALASPPSERERELEGALRHYACSCEPGHCAMSADDTDTPVDDTLCGRVAARALTAQPAGEGK